MATGGHGVTFSIGTPLVAVASVEEIDFPKLKKLVSRYFAHDQDFEQAVSTGAYSVEGFKMTLAWDVTAPSHAALLAAWASPDPVDMQFMAPDGETLAGSGIVSELGRVSKSKEHYQCEITVEPTGEWV